MKNRIGMVLLCTLLSISSITAFAADEYVGKVVTKEKEEGDTFVENASGKELQIRESGKLYNGYKAYTEDGYMWIALDENGVLKMDLDTKVKIEKTGKNLEVILEEGEVFFNISEEFADDEKFTIRTSTMTTGIRGTAGAVTNETREDGSTLEQVQLFEGKVEIISSNHDTESEALAAQLSSGQQYSHQTNADGTQNSNRQLVDLVADMVSGMSADEIRKSEELQARILEAIDGIDAPTLQEIIDTAEQKLADERKARNDKEKQRQQDIATAVEVLKELAEIDSETPTTTDTSGDPTTDTSRDTTTDTTDGSVSGAGTAPEPETPEPETPEPETEEPVSIVISYYYYSEDGVTLKLFGEQAGQSDTAPVQPKIQPSTAGSWTLSDGSTYDFATLLTEDTTMIWSPTE